MSEMLFFNVDEGYTESIIRGLRKSFLDEDDYNALRNAANMTDFKTALEATDYEEVVQQEANPIPVTRLKTILKQKLANEMNYIQSQSSSPLYDFIDLMRHGYMIETTVDIIEGIKSKIDFDLLVKRSDPLGSFPGMSTIKAAESDNYSSVYQTVLIDLPVGRYFHLFLENVSAKSASKDINTIDSLMKDYTQERTKNLLKKIWFGEMYKFCINEMDGPSREMMEELLFFESDCMTIQIIYNSLDNKQLVESRGRQDERKQYIHLLGKLYPGRDKELTMADSLEKLKAAVA